MVKVLSVYHFQNQKTKSVEDIVDACLLDDTKLVLVKKNCLVEIYDLNSENEKCVSNFSTIDEVLSIRYSLQGHYLAFLEIKNLRRISLRIYYNFENHKTSINARVLGVTPVYSSSPSLEIIEIPTKADIKSIACCQVKTIPHRYNVIIFFYKFNQQLK